MGNVIEIRNLVRRFGPQTVLDGINLDIAEGETMVIMGGSGCGKSTLLRHLIGSLQPSEGSIKILGEEIATVSEAGLDAVRKKFGILFQSGALFNSMSIADNIALPLREHTTLDSHIIEIQVMATVVHQSRGTPSTPHQACSKRRPRVCGNQRSNMACKPSMLACCVTPFTSVAEPKR